MVGSPKIVELVRMSVKLNETIQLIKRVIIDVVAEK